MSPEPTPSIWDRPQGYGIVSRVLHWLMAVLFAAQFLSAILRLIDRELPMTKTVWGIHYTLGFALLVLVAVRAVWGLLNLRTRPPHGKGLMGLASLGGHLALYALMLFVPAIGLLRAYAGGRGFIAFGVQIFQPGTRDEALMAPGQLLHGPAGWVLLALVAGHILMVFVHKYLWREDILGRMTRGYQDDRRLGGSAVTGHAIKQN
ncbi:cytochrome b [Rhizobium sp. C4]|uniref:cytochrome b n=1 Tax=Rhizobium sp. C4 TaxID=1349800 RepID=UPI001E5B64DB|nr:cytochrome b [Rhizobium sp. C4]MCD2172652.1 cytochrome b [Rhizobium sp. C4]